jgi:glycerol-3-phosphate dehydrogenase (NAD(P)+)
MGGITLKGAAAIQVIGGAYSSSRNAGSSGGGLPPDGHPHAAVANDQPLRMPWSTFFGGEA